MRSAVLLARLGAVVLCTSLASAQIGTSTISGRVTDSSGAVVPNVNVLVVNAETNFRFTAITNTEGLFRVQSLQPGPYRVTFEAAGFKRLVRENITVRTGDVLPVDAVLEVGNVTESIEVTASAQLIQTETSATGTVVEGKFFYSIPNTQRFVPTILTLVPGLQAGGRPWGANLGGYHVAGQRSSAIGFFEDGVTVNDATTGTNTIRPIVSTLAELNVLTTVPPAEYGHSSGGVISVVKKSGTNELHGLASMWGGVRELQHRRFFDMYRSSQPTQSRPNGAQVYRAQAEVGLSGPVFLPKVYDGRNKTFFYISYQRYFARMLATQAYTAVPTPDMKNGDMSFGGLGSPIFDPSTTRQLPDGTWARDPFPNTRVPLSRFDPVVQGILKIDPWNAPNTPGSFNAAGPVSNYGYSLRYVGAYPDTSVRIDHQFTPHFKIYGSYTHNYQWEVGNLSGVRFWEFDGSQGYLRRSRNQNLSAGMTWVVSPTTINDARMGYYRFLDARDKPSYQKNWAQTLGIPNVSGALMPAFNVYGLTVTGPYQTISETISFRDDLTKIHGTHAFKMGYELLRHRLNAWSVNRPSGDFRFDGITAGLQADGNAMPRTGNDFAGFLVGSVRQALFDQQLASWLPRSSIHSVYFQDDWKFSPTLTLNLGIRYSNESPFNTKYAMMSNFDPNTIDDVTGLKGAIVHPKSPLNRRDNNNFQPRVGMAWHPLRRWVFRGGFTVNTVDVKFPSTRGQFNDYVAQANQQRPPGDPRPLYQLSRGPDPVVFEIRPDGTSPFLGTNYGSRSVDWWASNLCNPYVLNWNLTTQYEINPNYVVEIMYQGSAGVGLIERWQANTFPIDYAKDNPALQAAVFRVPQNYRPYPQFGDILLRSNPGHSTFHSGTVKLEKRYSRGLNFLTFYTWSKTIDSQDDDNSGGGIAPIQNRSLEKGLAGYDVKHRFVGSVTYELPMGKGKRFLNRGGIWNHVFGGYSVVWIQTFQSGNPMTFSFANSPYNYYPTFTGTRRPNVVGKPSMRDNWRDFGGDRFNANNINAVLDMNDFAYPAAFTPGNAGRNIVSGPGVRWSQVSAQKNFHFSERLNAQVRWDFANVLHTFNFDKPTTTVDFLNPRTFGKITSDGGLTQLGGQPVMHLTLQLTF